MIADRSGFMVLVMTSLVPVMSTIQLLSKKIKNASCARVAGSKHAGINTIERKIAA
jgi:hypothetical protein